MGRTLCGSKSFCIKRDLYALGEVGPQWHVAPWSSGVQQQQAIVQLETLDIAAGSLPLPAFSGALGWESIASSEDSGSPKTWGVEQEIHGQLGVLDALWAILCSSEEM